MGIFGFFKKKNNEVENNKIQGKASENLIDDLQNDFITKSKANAERIVEGFNERYNGAFDYSEKSLIALDELLDNFSDYIGEMEDEMKNDMIAQAGSYIFEVARNTYGGKYYWYDELNQPIFVTGQPNFEISFLAFEKVKGRLENGTEDNIPFFYKGYVERVVNAKNGDIAMIV
ncbi:hypothetical protein [Flavobacterium sp.]|uniref:hypothetical protein n=1 Tax=Flavobacterium sp. TaxID=239 RepID=UPI00286DE67B|nr:hypothetical protein [Flavobacterium sp.]